MTGFDKLNNRLIEYANKTADEIIAKANEEIAKIEAEYALKKENAHQDILNSALDKAAGLKDSVRSALDAECNAIVDKYKTEMVTEVVISAANEIVSLKDEKYIAFMSGLLAKILIARLAYEKQYLEENGEDIAPEKYVLVLRKKDRDAYGEKIIAAMRRATVGKIPAAVLDKVVLANKTVSVKGGFIIEAGEDKIDASIDAIIEYTIRNAKGEISQMLFG